MIGLSIHDMWSYSPILVILLLLSHLSLIYQYSVESFISHNLIPRKSKLLGRMVESEHEGEKGFHLAARGKVMNATLASSEVQTNLAFFCYLEQISNPCHLKC